MQQLLYPILINCPTSYITAKKTIKNPIQNSLFSVVVCAVHSSKISIKIFNFFSIFFENFTQDSSHTLGLKIKETLSIKSLLIEYFL
jgi:hypothetical protein